MTAFGEALDQHFYRFAYLASVRFERELVLQRDDLIEPPHFLLFGNIIRQVLVRVRARALRVLEHERGVETHLAHQAQRLRVVLQRLVVETAEDIGRDSRFGQDTTDSGNAVQIPFARIFAVRHVLVPMPCYDLTPIISPTLGRRDGLRVLVTLMV